MKLHKGPGDKEGNAAKPTKAAKTEKKGKGLKREISFGKKKDKNAETTTDKKTTKSKEKAPQGKGSARKSKPQQPAKIKSSKPAIGIDVGSSKVKIAVGRLKNNRILLKSVLKHGIPENATQGGKIIHRNAVQASILHALESKNISIKDAHVVVNSSDIIQREITIPRVADNEILGVISYEISQYLPIDISAYVIQYKNLGEVETEQGFQLRVMVCAMPKAIALEYMETLNGINIKPQVLDVKTNALEKLIRLEGIYKREFKEKNLVFLDMGHTYFDISFYKAGQYRFNRIMDCGGKNLDEVMLRNLEISPIEAEKLKLHNFSRVSILDIYKVYGDTYQVYEDPNNSEEHILKDSIAVINHWIDEIHEVIKYYNSRDRDNVVDEMILYGGTASINDLHILLETHLNIPVNRIESLSCLEIAPDLDRKLVNKSLNAIAALIRL